MRAFEGIKALNLIEAVEPYLAADESMIDAHAASVSYMDYLMTCGGYQLRPALPYIPGTDAAMPTLTARLGASELEHARR